MAQIYVVASLGTNTGRTAGDIRMGRIKTLLIHRGGNPFTAAHLADSASLKTELQRRLSLPRTDPDKVFLFDGLREAEDKTGDPQTANLQDGYEEVLNEPLPKFVFKHTKGVAEHQSLVTFNGITSPIFFIDDKGVFWYKGASNNGGQGFGLSYFFASAPKPGGSGAINVGTINVSMATADEFKTNVGALKVDFTASELVNPTDLTLTEVAAASGYGFTLGVTNRFGGTSVYDALKVALSQSGAWKATLVETGAAVTVSAVTANDATKSFTLTLNNVPTIASGKAIILEFVGAAALAALATPIIGFEAVALKVIKP
jgi:hypothetical protein